MELVAFKQHSGGLRSSLVVNWSFYGQVLVVMSSLCSSSVVLMVVRLRWLYECLA